jgi:hypothetical protein
LSHIFYPSAWTIIELAIRIKKIFEGNLDIIENRGTWAKRLLSLETRENLINFMHNFVDYNS